MASCVQRRGLTRQAAGRGRGQADPLTADDVAAILATASLPRRTGRGMESEADAADRGATDRAIVAVLFQGGLRRSEAAALRWADVQDAADGRGIVVYVRRSKTDQDGTAADVRYLKNGCAAALRQLRSGRQPLGQRRGKSASTPATLRHRWPLPSTTTRSIVVSCVRHGTPLAGCLHHTTGRA